MKHIGTDKENQGDDFIEEEIVTDPELKARDEDAPDD